MSSITPLSNKKNLITVDTDWHTSPLKHCQDAIFIAIDNAIVYSNTAGLKLLKASDEKQLLGMSPATFLHDSSHAENHLSLKSLLKNNPTSIAQCCQCKALDGQLINVEVRANGFIDNGRSAIQLTLRDLGSSPFPPAFSANSNTQTTAKQAFSRVHEALHHEKEILEMIALDKPLTHILQDVCDRMERLLDNGGLCAIMLLDSGTQSLTLGAAPSLPENFCSELENIPVGLNSGSCAAAIHNDLITIVEDIASSPLWKNCADIALQQGLHSCWSLPIRTAFNVVLGTIDVYHHARHSPTEDEQALIMDASDLIALAIDKKHMEQSLEESEERYRAVVTNLTEGIMVLGSKGQILTCNPSAERILKITDASTVGRRHRYFKRIISEDGSQIKIGEDPASTVFRTGTPIFNLSIGLELHDHTIAWLLVNVLPINQVSNSATTAVLISFTDTTEVRETQRQLHYIASHDALTGLPNRHQLSQRLTLALANAQYQKKKVAVLFLDLDRFKNVNDTAGHAAGDTLLCDVATRLNSCIRTTDMLVRLGGDEFVIVAEDFDNALHLKDLAERVLARMREPFMIDSNEYHLGSSIGISIFPHDASDGPTLLRCADSAMYLAKESGRNNYQFFTTELNVRAQHRYALEKNLRRALTEQEFLVYYQPKVCLKTSRIVGAEALIRWQMPDLGLIPPNEFIPISEEIGLILPIGRWVLEQSCRQAKIWREKFSPDLVISVNISPKQFQDPSLLQFIQQVLSNIGLPGQALQLEITEGLLMGEAELLLPVFNAIKKLGVSISLDDFGTGFSSLSYLQRFPIDNLKIDRSFIRDIPQNQDSVVLTRAIIAMANALGMSVTAEGVEKADQMFFLTDSGCQEMQGFYFSKPLPVSDFENLLTSHTQ
ncbi:MAG: EAL domain-containing protein [Undibacterium sp.]|uniref:bifunctional diguanylate cyclase/phosphodiesterase n=1 Tax=Undibacterium sp. TaxID=1914977 RepID=UPI0027184563|nr:EAL domain-containing protein [Undibacterium sp.]MDO8651938.1 EAL domain-containing protein [Undibacterium sp.]